MKKVILGLLCLAMCFALTMSCDIPQSITLRGSPGLRVSLNPFDMFMDDNTPGLEDYITIEKIREMMGDSGEATVYEYTGTQYDGIQTYVVHYPIREMKLDLQKYIQEAIEGADQEPVIATIPTMPSGPFPSEGLYLGTDESNRPILTNNPGNPLFVISLADMANVITVVKGGPFGFQIDSEDDNHLKGKIQVKIPAFGMDDYVDGIESDDGSKLWFFAHDTNDDPTMTEFYPHGDPTDPNPAKAKLNEKDELEIYVKVTDASCSGKITLDLVFDWTEITINTDEIDDDEYLKGSYPISNSLSGFLGEGVEFKNVDGYIFVNGMGTDKTGNSAKLTLTVDDAPLVNYEDADLTDKEKPTFSGTTFNGALGTHSLGNSAIPLAEILNTPPADGESAIKLGYELNANITITKTEVTANTGRTITIDMVILIPLEFKVTIASSKSGYYKLDLDDMFPKPEEGKDLFGRDPTNEDDLFNSIDIKSLTITVKGHKENNTIIDASNLSIVVLDANKDTYTELGNPLVFSDDGPQLTLTGGIPKPFTPQFEILLQEKNSGDGFAPLIIKRADEPKFNFTLEVVAITSIDYTIDL